jgi:hypothetical protein
MNVISTGSSTERIIRTAIFMVLVDAFTVYFLWDGYVGYAQENREQLAKILGVAVEDVAPPRESVTASEATQLAESFDPAVPNAVAEHFGGPSVVHEADAYYLGHGGWLHVNVEDGQPRSAEWIDGPRTEFDQQSQRYIGWALAAVGLISTLFFVRVLSTRAVLSDSGLKLTGRPLITWDQIRGLKSVKSGMVDLEFEANGSRHTVQLDDYLYKDLAKITAAIAVRKGIDDPFAPIPQT